MVIEPRRDHPPLCRPAAALSFSYVYTPSLMRLANIQQVEALGNWVSQETSSEENREQLEETLGFSDRSLILIARW